jgi:hypothetical protein
MRLIPEESGEKHSSELLTHSVGAGFSAAATRRRFLLRAHGDGAAVQGKVSLVHILYLAEFMQLAGS